MLKTSRNGSASSLRRGAIRVEAYCDGIGWTLFTFARSLDVAQWLAQQTRFLDPKRWPGLVPRPVRIVEPTPLGPQMHVVSPPSYLSIDHFWQQTEYLDTRRGWR